jgi:tight adherence protein B
MDSQLIPFAVFAGVVILVLGAYFGLVVREEERLIGKLKPKSDVSRILRGVLKKEDLKDSYVGPINRVLQRSGASLALKDFLKQAGLKMNVSSFVLFSACLGLIAYLIAALLSHMVFVGLIAGGIVMFLPYMYGRYKRNKRIAKFEEQFPESIDLVARALRAGHALPTGLGMVGDEMPAPVGTEFRMLFDEQNFGLSLPDAMRNFAARIPLLDARFFVTAVLTQRESGGNLAEVLDNLASVIRDRFKVKRQVRVISAHGRITGVVLSALPPCLAVAIMFISPTHLKVLTGDPIGHDMIYAAIVMQILGTIIIRKLCNIEY